MHTFVLFTTKFKERSAERMKTKHTTTLCKRLGAWALTIALVVGMLPQTVFAAGTDTGKAIQLGAGGISGYSDTISYDYIYYGNWKAPDTHTTSGPIKWRVLDDQTNTGGEGLFLLSDVLLGAGNLGDLRFEQSYHYVDGTYYKGSAHNGDHTNCQIMNAWQGSDAQDWCETFYSDSLTTQEQGAVLATTKSDGAFTSTSNVPFADSENILNGDKVYEWKLTLLDSTNHAGFNVTTTDVSTTTAGGSVSISYEGATVGANEYLSAMITSGSGENETVLYYGRLKQLTTGEASGTQEIAIPALSEGTYTLRVFNEQYNGDYNMDYASDFKNVTLTVSADTQGTPNTPAYDLTVNESKVAFAGHEWWVIGYNGDGVYSTAEDTSHVTLLAANLDTEFQNILFRTGSNSSFDNSTQYSGDNWYYADNPDGMTRWTTPNEYAGSTLQQTLEDIAEGFPAKEQAVITARNLASGAAAGNNWSSGKWEYLDGIAGQGVSVQKLWAISEEEWNTINDATVRAYDDFWWLRSPYYHSGNEAWRAHTSGESMYYITVYSDYVAARPALSLNLDSVLFTSSAAGGKSSATAGNGLVAMETPTGTVKFTMQDASQTLTVNATATQSTQTGATLSFTYSNATTGTNQYVSCVLTDDSGSVKYYGKLADSSNAASGDLSIPLTGVADGTYTLKIFSEEANGDMYTDFCSEPVTMTVAITEGVGTVSDFRGTLLHEHEHSWSNDWSSDDTHHWHNCTAEECPITEDNQKDGYAAHNFTQQVNNDTYLASAATCTAPAEYYYSCVCGAKGTEVFTDGDALDHDWGDWRSNGNGTHSRTCSRCPETKTESCTGGTATCTNRAVCTTCGSEYGDVNPDEHTGGLAWVQTETTHKQVYNCCGAEISEAENHTWENGRCTVCQYPCSHTGGTATCSQKAVCTICGSQYGELNPDNHSPASEWTQENGKHHHICQNGCGAHLDEANCDGGTATCISKAKCSVCGHEYGDYGAHDLTVHDAKEPTCTETGNNQYWECSVCSRLFAYAQGNTGTTIADVTIAATGHNWGNPAWKWADDGSSATATFTCANDNAHTEQVSASITSEVKAAATCTESGTTAYKASVNFNGTEYNDTKEVTDIAPTGHTWGDWTSNGKNEHTRTCSVCKATETGNCFGGKATCVDKADCDICHAEYGTVDADNHTNLVKTDAKQATHLAEGNTEYWYCDGCNKYFSDEDGTKEIALADTVLPKLTGHTPDETGWHSDETNHWQTCECGVKLNEAAHDFVWETDKEATATEAGSKHEECTVCGYKKAAVEIPATGTPEEPTDPSKPGDTPPGSNQTGDKDNPDTGKTDSPQTGDSSNIVLWIALALISGVALAGTCIFGRRKKYSR